MIKKEDISFSHCFSCQEKIKTGLAYRLQMVHTQETDNQSTFLVADARFINNKLAGIYFHKQCFEEIAGQVYKFNLEDINFKL